LSGDAEGARPALVEDSPAGAGDQGSEFGILRGLEWLVGDLAARGPVAVVADDLHWADAASLRFLVLLAERVEDLRLVLVVAMRPREPGADQVLLDALVAASASMVVRPSP
jgi:hypothetical protein